MKPPITPNGPASAPSRSSIPGMIVWYGRRPGSTRPEIAKQAPRFWRTIPVPGATMPAPKLPKRLWMNDTAVPSPSTAHRYTVPPPGSAAGAATASRRRATASGASRSETSAPSRTRACASSSASSAQRAWFASVARALRAARAPPARRRPAWAGAARPPRTAVAGEQRGRPGRRVRGEVALLEPRGGADAFGQLAAIEARGALVGERRSVAARSGSRTWSPAFGTGLSSGGTTA